MNKRLKELRKALGLKQREFGDRLAVSSKRVSAWESGEDGFSTRIAQICKEFHVRREWLEKGEGEMFDPHEFDKENAREFCCRVFESLPEELQEVVLEALRASASKSPKVEKSEPTNQDVFINVVAQSSLPTDDLNA